MQPPTKTGRAQCRPFGASPRTRTAGFPCHSERRPAASTATRPGRRTWRASAGGWCCVCVVCCVLRVFGCWVVQRQGLAVGQSVNAQAGRVQSLAWPLQGLGGWPSLHSVHSPSQEGATKLRASGARWLRFGMGNLFCIVVMWPCCTVAVWWCLRTHWVPCGGAALGGRGNAMNRQTGRRAL